MLDAFNRKGVRSILAPRSPGARAQNEDAITSMVFTPWRYMAASDVLSAIDIVLGPVVRRQIGERSIDAVEVLLWPAGLSAVAGDREEKRRREPDLVVRLEGAPGYELVIVGEMKWDLYPPATDLAEQVNQQRKAIRGWRGRACDISSFALVRSEKPEYARLGVAVLSWTELHRRLAAFCRADGSPSAVRTWAADVARFLTLAERAIFTGFSASYGTPIVGAERLFYSSTWPIFSNSYGELGPISDAPLFYSKAS